MIKVENLSMLFSTEEVQTKALNEVTFNIVNIHFLVCPYFSNKMSES